MPASTGVQRLVLLSGCSGGGKSTVLAELADRGFAVVEEPGRRIVEAQTDAASPLLPWIDLAQFARAAVDLAVEDFKRASEQEDGFVFFDRGLIDALIALRHAAGGRNPKSLPQNIATIRSSFSSRRGRKYMSATVGAGTPCPRLLQNIIDF